MFVNQNGLCLICGQTEKSGKKLSVDHNHETGKVRGLFTTYKTANKFADKIEPGGTYKMQIEKIQKLKRR